LNLNSYKDREVPASFDDHQSYEGNVADRNERSGVSVDNQPCRIDLNQKRGIRLRPGPRLLLTAKRSAALSGGSGVRGAGWFLAERGNGPLAVRRETLRSSSITPRVVVWNIVE
jgi:hypothetical protein